ncbi:RNA polymerase sigma factor FliA [Collimonas sp.]|jgi:RNA polymerase sigma factor for flagellar operon FliA|uniref:RNA polymerase sigma factor FliA n=1 Tax=Collimonas sp. TaxID=1963772 RepID=UPI002BDD2B81|nr:RNA polymerase sigma factor FliA [Collimonas sp.]HWX01686.1 RNA polymerase sigma factor FliA [Collimonas sp.]
MYTAQGRIDKSDTLAKHAPLVRRLALQLIAKLPASVELDDMIQAGMLGLLDAANRFQEDQGAQFETYASQRIRGAMLDELRANDWLSRGLRQSSRSVDAAVQMLEQRLARAPSEREIAQAMQLSLEDYQRLLQEIHGSQLLYYEDCEGDGGENAFLDRQHGSAESKRDNDPLQRLLDSGMRQLLVDAIAMMPERERLLLSLYYEQEMNLREIGAVLEVSQSRVCQLHSQAISRLRARLSEHSWSEAA